MNCTVPIVAEATLRNIIICLHLCIYVDVRLHVVCTFLWMRHILIPDTKVAVVGLIIMCARTFWDFWNWWHEPLLKKEFHYIRDRFEQIAEKIRVLFEWFDCYSNAHFRRFENTCDTCTGIWIAWALGFTRVLPVLLASHGLRWARDNRKERLLGAIHCHAVGNKNNMITCVCDGALCFHRYDLCFGAKNVRIFDLVFDFCRYNFWTLGHENKVNTQ